jgi:hypothetical protein
MLRTIRDRWGRLIGRSALAQALEAKLPAEKAACLRRARAGVEMADLALRPIDAVDADRVAGPALTLLVEAVYFALLAQPDGAPAASLHEALETAPPAVWADLTVSAAQEARDVLVRFPFASGALRADADDRRDATRVRKLAEHLVDRAATRERAILRGRLRIIASYVGLVAAIAGLVVASMLIVRRVKRGPELSHGRPTKQSSSLAQCAPPAYRCGVNLLFHTNTEDSPWYMVDLGPGKSVSSVEIENRTDCCKERALPLVIEVSSDAKTWREVARRDEAFDEWTARFPRQPAAYVRLRVPRATALHLKSVDIY